MNLCDLVDLLDYTKNFNFQIYLFIYPNSNIRFFSNVNSINKYCFWAINREFVIKYHYNYSKKTTNMVSIKCVNVLALVTIVIIIIVENSNADSKYDIYI